MIERDVLLSVSTNYDKYHLLTAVLFIGRVSAVVVSITDPSV